MVDLNECEESVLLAEFKLWERCLENIRSSNIPRNAMEVIVLYNRHVYSSVLTSTDFCNLTSINCI